MHRTASLLLCLVLSGALASAGAAQVPCGSMADCPAPPPSATGLRQELSVAGVNALLGGMTAVVARWARAEPAGDAFWTGALGGGIAYAGKRVAAEGFDGAGLLGRELASVGGSIVRNAASGRGALDELVLPIGPVRLYVSRAGGIVPRVDVPTLVATAVLVTAYDARFDARSSLSSGAVVLRGDLPMPGLSAAGVIAVWPELPAAEGPRLLGHERVHVLQYDQAFLLWGEPLDRWLTAESPWGRGLLSRLDFGAVPFGLNGALALALHYHDRPWEQEAYFLAQSAHPLPPRSPHRH